MLIDIGHLRELSYVKEEKGYVCVGALTRHHDLANSLVAPRECAGLAHVAGQIGDPQVRHRGTIGGSIAHGDPASDLPRRCSPSAARSWSKDRTGLERSTRTTSFSVSSRWP